MLLRMDKAWTTMMMISRIEKRTRMEKRIKKEDQERGSGTGIVIVRSKRD